MVIVVMGVSGSGKTSVGSALAARLGWPFLDADDLHPPANVAKMHRGVPLTDDDRRPWIRAVGEAVHDHVAAGRDLVVACSALRKWHRDVLRAGAADPRSIRFVYLRGTYPEIDRRLRSRVGHFMPESLLESQFETLEAPDPTEALVLDIHPAVGEIVEAILRALRLPSGA